MAPLRIAALAREFLGVEEVGPAGRRGLDLVAVVGEHQVVDDRADAAGVHGTGQVACGATDLGDVELLVQALVAADLELVGLDLHDVPVVVAALDLRAQHAEAAVPRFVDQLGAGGIERLEEHLLLAVLVGAAPGHDGQVVLGVRRRCRPAQRRGRGEAGEQVCFFIVAPSVEHLPAYAANSQACSRSKASRQVLPRRHAARQRPGASLANHVVSAQRSRTTSRQWSPWWMASTRVACKRFAGIAVAATRKCSGRTHSVAAAPVAMLPTRRREQAAAIGRAQRRPRLGAAAQHVVVANKAGDERIRPACRTAACGEASCSMRPVVEHGDAVRQGHRLGLVVGDVDHGHAELAVQAADLQLHLLAQMLVERRQRLVHQHHPRLEHQRRAPTRRAAAGRPRAAAAGVRRGAAQMHLGQRRGHPLAHRRRGHLAHRQRKGDVLRHRHLREQRVALEHDAHAAPVRRQRLDRPAVEADVPAVGVSKPASSISVVVLPEPEGPSSVMNSPASTCRSRSSTAGSDAAGVDLAQAIDLDQRHAGSGPMHAASAGFAKGADYRGARAPRDDRAQAQAQGFTGAIGPRRAARVW